MLTFIQQAADSALTGNIATGGAMGAGYLILKEILDFARAKLGNGNGKNTKSGDLPPAHWNAKFDSLGSAMLQLAENQKVGNEILQGIRTDLAVVLDRTTR